MPLAEAVIFAMLASYMWSRTIVPTMAMYLLSAEDEYIAEDARRRETWDSSAAISKASNTHSSDSASGYRDALGAALDHAVLFSHLLSALLRSLRWPDHSSWAAISFRKVDAGQIRLHMRARTGLRIEETARLADQVDADIRQTIPARDLVTVLDNIGVPYSGINLTYSNSGTIGTSDAEILVQLKPERGKVDQVIRQ